MPTLTAHEILRQTAEWLNSGRFVPPSAVNNITRDALLRAEQATLLQRSPAQIDRVAALGGKADDSRTSSPTVADRAIKPINSMNWVEWMMV